MHGSSVAGLQWRPQKLLNTCTASYGRSTRKQKVQKVSIVAHHIVNKYNIVGIHIWTRIFVWIWTHGKSLSLLSVIADPGAADSTTLKWCEICEHHLPSQQEGWAVIMQIAMTNVFTHFPTDKPIHTFPQWVLKFSSLQTDMHMRVLWLLNLCNALWSALTRDCHFEMAWTGSYHINVQLN